MGLLQKPVPDVAAAAGPQPRRLAAPHLSRAAVRHLHHWTPGADRPGARHRPRPGAGPRARAGTRGPGAQPAAPRAVRPLRLGRPPARPPPPPPAPPPAPPTPPPPPPRHPAPPP